MPNRGRIRPSGFGEGFAPTDSIRAPESPSSSALPARGFRHTHLNFSPKSPEETHPRSLASSEARGFPGQPVSRADLRHWSLGRTKTNAVNWRQGWGRGSPERPRSGGGAVGRADGGNRRDWFPRGPEGGPRPHPVVSRPTVASGGCPFSCLQAGLNHTNRHRALVIGRHGMRQTKPFELALRI
jgi:hypothetical protein